ncbi:cadmium-translocating P-type ATPase [Rhodoferax saidenbachensis]|uniref:P-type Zn(2+) transporter n=2 Tax=Rhodoferax saidenbachensis TaxID=1484693 RepID=A0A1P8KB12_9BURK|nr:heavy metal translocating P-type ATPase [Rhodoferax saidenbachensis]APW43186.1 cadmium-translocating P-type ATPase [Rhodoferax saidenbachensis]
MSTQHNHEAHGHDHRHDHGHSHPEPHTHAHGGDACCGTSEAPPMAPLAPPAAKADGVQTPIRILQMDCPTEEALLRKKLGGMAGVTGLEFNLMQRVLTVTHAPQAIEPILAAVRTLGFTPEIATGAAAQESSAPQPAKPWWPLALAGVAAIASEAAHWAGMPEWLAAALALVAVALSGITTYKKGWIAIRNGNLNINALMSIAVTGALLLGQWPEAAMVMVLFTIAELIEAQSLDRARNAIRGLLQLAPERATVLQADGTWQDVAAKTVAVGARVRIKPGERIALDGTITSGRSTIDQAPITGESLPVEKAEGDTVFAGTINASGSFEYTVTAAASDSTLARIIHAVEEAQGARAPTQRFVDQFARIYTPVVFALALGVAVLPPLLLGGVWFDWIYKALVLLVIACPCALVISTPVTIVSGLAAAARQGILIKGGVYLEEGRRLTWLALDKTGTITHGKPAQTDCVVLSSMDSADLRSLAASLAARSDHPVSKALAQAAERDGVALRAVDAFAALPGRGTQGVIDGRLLYLGNHRLIHEQGRCSDALEARLSALEQQGKTVILLADEREVHGMFAVADTVKESSRQAIAELHALGIQTIMLTGDNVHTAQAIAAQVGIDEARGDLLPEDKLKAIEAKISTGGAVGMVGDGINDAPALARADIGFAMGAAGTGTAIETADVALMDDDLRKLPRFVRLSRRTHALLVQNIALALGIKAVFLVLTLTGAGTMWMAVFADVGASLLVVANGLRLLRKPAAAG